MRRVDPGALGDLEERGPSVRFRISAAEAEADAPARCARIGGRELGAEALDGELAFEARLRKGGLDGVEELLGPARPGGARSPVGDERVELVGAEAVRVRLAVAGGDDDQAVARDLGREARDLGAEDVSRALGA